MIDFSRCKMIDLTHPLSSAIPSWNGSIAFSLEGEDRIEMLTSAGTHIDFPALFFPDGLTIDRFPLEKLCGPAAVLDVSKKAQFDYQISVEDIESYEAKHGSISKGSIVVGYTGWSRYWNDPKAYRNVDKSGHTRFPTFSSSAIEALVERDIHGVAIDVLALESLHSDFPAHQHLLGAGKFIIENIANASHLPPKGAYILALPLKIAKGPEAPARVIALV